MTNGSMLDIQNKKVTT